MNAEFNWWLLIVGLVLGAALTWLVMSESVRRDVDITESEQRGEARWIATALSAAGRAITPDRVEEILKLHREYLAAPPPDDPIEATVAPASETFGPTADAPNTRDRDDAVASPPEGRLERDG